MGTTPYVADQSLGQLSGLLASVIPGVSTINTIGGLLANALRGKPVVGDTYDGGLVGQTIDEGMGQTPGRVVGYTGSPVASSTNSRGERPSGDSRPMDRGGVAQSTGDLPDTGGASGLDDGGAEFSSVRLADRRRPYDDLAAVDLLRGLL
jgi:hypothetical protein